LGANAFHPTRHLVDVYAELVAYASARHGKAVRPDDIRTMMTKVFINLSKTPAAMPMQPSVLS
jgi:hypothetical protein